jgi:hypothetical protein
MLTACAPSTTYRRCTTTPKVNAESVYHETDVVDEHPYRTAPETPEMQALAASSD